MQTKQPRRHWRWQFRLGTLLIVATVVGCLAGVFGPPLVQWLRRPRPIRTSAFPLPRATFADDLDDFYLEPAETPFE